MLKRAIRLQCHGSTAVTDPTRRSDPTWGCSWLINTPVGIVSTNLWCWWEVGSHLFAIEFLAIRFGRELDFLWHLKSMPQIQWPRHQIRVLLRIPKSPCLSSFNVTIALTPPFRSSKPAPPTIFLSQGPVSPSSARAPPSGPADRLE